MQDAREYFYHEMKRQRAREQWENIALALLALLCIGFMIFCFYIYMED